MSPTETESAARVLNLSPSGDKTFFSLLSAHPLSAPTPPEQGAATAAFVEGNHWAATPMGIHPSRTVTPLREQLPRAPRSQAPTAPLLPRISSASLGENYLFITILAAFSTFQQPTSLPP